MINSIKETYKDFLAFLKKPTDQPDPIQTRSQKTKRLFSLLALDIPVMVIIMAIISGIEKLGLVNKEGHKLTMFIQMLPIWLIILFGVVILPLIEELIFRLYLRFKQNYLARLIILLASVTGKQNKIKIETNLTTFWQNKFRSIFYLSALIFGFYHLVNYEYSNTILLLSPILIAPQIVMGLFLGYLRVKYGLILGYFMHGLHNAIFLMIPIIFMSGAIEKINIKTNDYSLKVEECTLRLNTSASFGTDSIRFNGTSIKSIIAFLLEKDENLIESNNNQMADKKINLTFKNYLKDNSENKNIIMNHLRKIYNFKIESDTRREEAWELYVQDSIVLTKHTSSASESSGSVRISSKNITIKNMELDQLAETITSEYKKYIINKTDITKKFDITIPKKDFNELKKLLNSQYGLLLQKTEKELEYTTINFKNAK